MLSTSDKYGDGGGSGVTVNNNWNCGGCCGGGGGVTDHEQLSGLLGGDATGHYHLTKEEWEKVLELLEEPEPEPEPEWTEYDGGWAGTTEAEYAANKDHWLDGGDAAGGQTGDVNGGEA